MKKAIFPIIFITLFLFSATTEPSRFATPEEMGKAVLAALKNNDSIRFLELFPSQKETNAAFVDPCKDSSIYYHEIQWAGSYFLDKSAWPRRMFREARHDVIEAGYDWKDVEFVSIETKKLTKRSPGIDYLYNAKLTFVVNTYKIEVLLSDAMETNNGWNCGLGLGVSYIETKETRELTKKMSAEVDRMIDSMQRADSINKIIYERDKYEQEHKKKPH